MSPSPRQPRWGRRIAGVAVTAAALGTTVLLASGAGAAAEHKITICHATDSVTNPYVSITVDYHSTIKAGHGAHDGPVYTEGIEGRWGDIIPAFDFGDGKAFEGQNLEDGGQGLLDAGCVGTVETTTTTINA
jgi:hypothetical protein